eukprot:6370460-Prymnesium_polylepis.1
MFVGASGGKPTPIPRTGGSARPQKHTPIPYFAVAHSYPIPPLIGIQPASGWVPSRGHTRTPDGLWPMVRRKAMLERYAALRCLWHG